MLYEVITEAVKKDILSIHPYELPEIISVPLVDGFDGYLNWVNQVTK